MSSEQQARIVHAWLSHITVAAIARIEDVPTAEVEKVVARAVGVPTGELRLRQ